MQNIKDINNTTKIYKIVIECTKSDFDAIKTSGGEQHILDTLTDCLSMDNTIGIKDNNIIITPYKIRKLKKKAKL